MVEKLKGWHQCYGGGMLPREGQHVQVVQHSLGQPVAMVMSRLDTRWFWEPTHVGSSTIPTHWRVPVNDSWPIADSAKPNPSPIGEATNE